MGLAVSLVTAFSCLFVSLVRKFTPESVRMIAQLAIIATFVIVVDQFMRAYMFTLSKTLSVFVGLIITNCIVMGRTESMAKNVPPLPAFLDGLAAGAGYAVILFLVAALREFFGFGTLFGVHLIPDWCYACAEHPDRYQNFGLMVLAPAAFFILGLFIWLANTVKGK
jgi:Na+-transporting NADH:ubiquinone oxidoreductase subunit D